MVMVATVLQFPSRTEIHWDLLAGLSPKETTVILLREFSGDCFSRQIEEGFDGFPGGVVFQIFSKCSGKRILKLEVWGSEERTTYIDLLVESVPELSEQGIRLETGIECPLAHDREGVMIKVFDLLRSVAEEQIAA